MSTEGGDHYVGAAPTVVEIAGHKFWVNVHLAAVRGRYVCVGIDLRSFYGGGDVGRLTAPDPGQQVKPTNGEWVEVNSPVMRALRTSEVIEAAQAPLLEATRAIADKLTDLSAALGVPANAAPEEVAGAFFDSPGRAKRGPRPQLDDEALRDVVAATYRISVRRPVHAVREALEASGLLRPPVTIDQARKAVATARARGFIPPAERGSKRQEDQS